MPVTICAHTRLPRLRSVVQDIRKRLSTTPTTLPPYFHVVSDTIPVVLKNLDFWLSLNKSTRRMLADHQHMSPMERADAAQFRLMPGANPDFKRKLEENIAAERNAFRQLFLNPTTEDLLKWGFIEEGEDPTRAREYMREHVEEFVDAMQNATKHGKMLADEEHWYSTFKVFLPPEKLWRRHPGLSQAWSQFRQSGEVERTLEQKVRSPQATAWNAHAYSSPVVQLTAHIESKWKPNITMFVGVATSFAHIAPS